MSGIFTNYKQAKENAKRLSAKGFEGLFVISYNNGSKISLSDAKLLSGKEDINNTTNEEIYFTVQIGAYSHKLNEQEMVQFERITEKYNINITKVDGALFLYTVGKYKTYKQAANVKKDIKNMEFDGFIIAFKNGSRISAQEAIKLLNN